MKTLALLMGGAVGFVAGACVRYPSVAQAAYRAGFVAGVDSCRREAVREGHGHWERHEDGRTPNAFEWNQVRAGSPHEL